MVTIRIIDHVQDCLTNSSGYSLLVILRDAVKNHDCIQLSFSGISATSSSFLNSSLGALVEEFGIKVLNQIKPIQVTATQAAILKKYVHSLRNSIA